MHSTSRTRIASLKINGGMRLVESGLVPKERWQFGLATHSSSTSTGLRKRRHWDSFVYRHRASKKSWADSFCKKACHQAGQRKQRWQTQKVEEREIWVCVYWLTCHICHTYYATSKLQLEAQATPHVLTPQTPKAPRRQCRDQNFRSLCDWFRNSRVSICKHTRVDLHLRYSWRGP